MNDGGTRTEQLAGELERAILTGRLMRGEALPSERRLVEWYQVSRATVRAAVQRLIAKGLAVPVGGQATVVAEGRWTFDRLVELIGAKRGEPQGVALTIDLLAMRRLHLAEIAARACEQTTDLAPLLFTILDLRRQVTRGAHVRMIQRVEREALSVVIESGGSLASDMLIASVDRLFDYVPRLLEALPDGLLIPLPTWDALASAMERHVPLAGRQLMLTALEEADRVLVAAMEGATSETPVVGER